MVSVDLLTVSPLGELRHRACGIAPSVSQNTHDGDCHERPALSRTNVNSVASKLPQLMYAAVSTDPIPRRLFRVLPGGCLLYTSPSPRDRQKSRMPSSA